MSSLDTKFEHCLSPGDFTLLLNAIPVLTKRGAFHLSEYDQIAPLHARMMSVAHRNSSLFQFSTPDDSDASVHQGSVSLAGPAVTVETPNATYDATSAAADSDRSSDSSDYGSSSDSESEVESKRPDIRKIAPSQPKIIPSKPDVPPVHAERRRHKDRRHERSARRE
jgi:hypothetical protein